MLKITAVLADPAVDVSLLLVQWEEAKAQEVQALARRREIEAQLCEHIAAPEEGQKTHRMGAFSITRTNGFSYSGKAERVIEVARELELPEPLVKYELWESAIKKLKKSDPTSFDILVSEGALVCKPRLPHFEICRKP